MIADLAQDINAGQSIPAAVEDVIHLLGRDVRSVQLPLLCAQLAEEHLHPCIQDQSQGHAEGDARRLRSYRHCGQPPHRRKAGDWQKSGRALDN